MVEEQELLSQDESGQRTMVDESEMTVIPGTPETSEEEWVFNHKATVDVQTCLHIQARFCINCY